MAKQTGILNSLSGMIGNIVCCTWKGIPYIRTRPIIPKSRKPTLRQAMQREKFKIANRFIRNFRGLISVCFQEIPGKIERNVALGHLMKNAIIGDYPNYSIDYSRVLVTMGDLKSAKDAHVISETPGILSFSWENNTGEGNAISTDKAILVVYHEESDNMFFSTDEAMRSHEHADFNLNFLSGKEVHVWLSFRGWLKPLIAESVYLGKLHI